MVFRHCSGKAQPGDKDDIDPCYLWLGGIPVEVQVGGTKYRTSRFPKNGRYLVPIKASVRKVENLEKDDRVTLRLEIHL